MKKLSILATVISVILFSSCKKETLFTPDTTSVKQVSEVIEPEQISSQKTTDYRNKFVGTYNGVSIATTTTAIIAIIDLINLKSDRP